MTFEEQLHAAVHSEPDKPAMDFQGLSFTKGDIARLADETLALLDRAGVPREASVGVLARNRPLHAAAMLGLITGGRRLTAIYAMQAADSIADEIVGSKFAAVIADDRDWAPQVIDAARRTGSAGIRLDLEAEARIAYVNGLDRAGSGPFRMSEGEPGLEILSSGTTGKPKRILFPSRMLVRTVESVLAGRNGPVEPDILVWPYGGIGGMCSLVASPIIDRYTALLEKFTVADWVAAVERLQPKLVSIVPAMARMILDAKVPPEKLACINYVYGGSAPMSRALQDEFEATYDLAVIWAYGATEFCGTVISWSPDLHREFRHSKAGAMGRAVPGVSLRVADAETGAILPQGRDGYLEALVPAVSDQWLKTTDLVMIDEDGFVFHKGRGDGAILRGGHKILPEKVVDALRRHPAVLDAAVIGMDDARLGQVPVAAVEVRAGVEQPSEAELRDHARGTLIAPHVPTRFIIVDALPRTTSMKIDLSAVRQMFASDNA